MSGPRAAVGAPDAELSDLIVSGATGLGVPLDAAQVAKLTAYLRLIERWNGTYNLTAVREPRAMATQHIVDSLAVLGPLQAVTTGRVDARVLDVGSGAGLPGVVIAVVEPMLSVACIDSVGKKAAFITQVASTLQLPRLTSIHGRIESLPATSTYDAIVSRAFASLADFVLPTRHLLAADGRWLAMKGKMPFEEIAAAKLLGVEFRGAPIEVPGLGAERCILIGQPMNESKR